MVTKVDVYTSLPEAPTLPLSASVYAGDDLLQVISIDGLDPVKASLNLSSLAAVDGESLAGAQVPSRNIVLTLNPNPDWNTWSHESLRDLVYLYFTPKRAVKLVFESDELGSVEISGVVESISANMFTSDPPYIVSIICLDPYFTSVDPVELSGPTIRPDGALTDIVNVGNMETPIYVKLLYVSGASPEYVRIQYGNPALLFFHTVASVDADHYFDLNSRPRFKYVREVNLVVATVANRLSGVQDGSIWPVIPPGDSQFAVITDAGVQSWALTYFKRFSGI